MARPKGAKQKQKTYSLPEFVEYKQPTPEFYNKETKLTFIDVRHGEFTASIKLMESAGNVSLHPIEKQARKMQVIMAVASSQEAKDKRKTTMIERFGTQHALQNKELYQKAISTTKKNYGVEKPLQNSNILNRMQKKFKQTYGYENAAQNPDRLNILPNGKSVGGYCRELGVPRCHANKIYKQHGAEFTQKWIETHTITKSALEMRFEDLVAGMKITTNNNKEVLQNHRYRPDFIVGNIAIDVDGLIYHSQAYHKNSRYHLEKRKAYESEGWKLLQFRQNEIIEKPEIVKSIIKAKLNIYETKVFARKTILKPVSQKDACQFLSDNHLMSQMKSCTSFGLYHNEELVSLISVKRKDTGLDVSRFCNKNNTLVIGGLSKLLAHCVKLYKPEYIQSFVDLRYGSGESLLKQGYIRMPETLGWSWTDGYNVHNRLYCRANMDERRLTEAEHAEELGLYRIYDAGQAKFIKEIKNG